MKTSTATQKLPMAIALAAISASTVAISQAEAAIISVNPLVDPLQGPGFITFDEVVLSGVVGGSPTDPSVTQYPGNNYNNIFFARDYQTDPNTGALVLNPDPNVGLTFAERFVNQQIQYATNPVTGPWDVVPGSPTPTNPLALQVGLADQNLVATLLSLATPDNKLLAGVGPLGYSVSEGVGEGAIAILFSLDQGEFGFDLLGTSLGSTTLKFFRRDGSLIDTIVLDLNYSLGYQDGSYAFKSTVGNEIAGVSITNNDVGGIGIDMIIYNNPGSPPVQNVPEASSVLGLLGIGVLGGGLKLKSKLKS